MLSYLRYINSLCFLVTWRQFFIASGEWLFYKKREIILSFFLSPIRNTLRKPQSELSKSPPTPLTIATPPLPPPVDRGSPDYGSWAISKTLCIMEDYIFQVALAHGSLVRKGVHRLLLWPSKHNWWRWEKSARAARAFNPLWMWRSSHSLDVTELFNCGVQSVELPTQIIWQQAFKFGYCVNY